MVSYTPKILSTYMVQRKASEMCIGNMVWVSITYIGTLEIVLPYPDYKS